MSKTSYLSGIVVALGVALASESVAIGEPEASESRLPDSVSCKRRRRPRKTKRTTKKLPEVSARAAAALFVNEPVGDPQASGAQRGGAERRPGDPQASGAQRGGAEPKAGVRKSSGVTPGAPSRWSNQGAIEPVAAPVPLQAPLPERNLPRPSGVSTPGQRLRGDEDLISARLSFSGYRLSTNGQDLVYANELEGGNLVRVDADRDIELLRGRATLAYERIGASNFSAFVDTEFRPRLNGQGREDHRLNALYAAWGLTEVRRRGGPTFGVALGRLAIREAGYAQADGLSVRWQPLPSLHLGAFGGVTGNPFGYNWALRASEAFSTDWVTGGAFGRWRGPNVQASLAGVVTVTSVPRPPPDPGGTDRIYVHADVGWQPAEEMSVFLSGFIDLLPSGQLIQSAEAAFAYTPDRWNLRLGLGRFSTVSYEVSTAYSYEANASQPDGNDVLPNNAVIVDADGNAVVPFDSARLTAVYNQIRVSAAYRFLPPLEGFVRLRTLIRDVSFARDAVSETAEEDVPQADTVNFAPLRLLPAVGARFRDPKLLDADLQVTFVIDEQSQADAVIRAAAGRELFGFYAKADARYLVGAIDAFDGGGTLSYGFPRDWLPGFLQLRLSIRYFMENVAVDRPASPAQVGQLDDEDIRPTIPTQESLLLFGGLEWRL